MEETKVSPKSFSCLSFQNESFSSALMFYHNSQVLLRHASIYKKPDFIKLRRGKPNYGKIYF